MWTLLTTKIMIRICILYNKNTVCLDFFHFLRFLLLPSYYICNTFFCCWMMWGNSMIPICSWRGHRFCNFISMLACKHGWNTSLFSTTKCWYSNTKCFLPWGLFISLYDIAKMCKYNCYNSSSRSNSSRTALKYWQLFLNLETSPHFY